MSLYSVGAVGDYCTGDGPWLPSPCWFSPQALLYILNGNRALMPAQVIGAGFTTQHLDPALTLPTPAGQHTFRETVTGSDLVFVNGVPLCKIGDEITNTHYPPNIYDIPCVGSVVAQGSTLVFTM